MDVRFDEKLVSALSEPISWGVYSCKEQNLIYTSRTVSLSSLPKNIFKGLPFLPEKE